MKRISIHFIIFIIAGSLLGWTGCTELQKGVSTGFIVATIYSGSDYAADICISGNYAYIADALHGVEIIDISDPYPEPPLSYTIVGWLHPPAGARHIYTNGNYAYILNPVDGLQVIDITDPTKPVLKGHVGGGTENGEDLCADGNYVYVAESFIYSPGKVQIVDVSNPSAPLLMGAIDTRGPAKAVTRAGQYLYVADIVGLLIIDVTDPLNPHIEGSIELPQQVALDVCLSGNYAFITGFHDGVYVIDITDPSRPNIVTTISLNPYNIPCCMQIDSHYLYVLDGVHMWVVDISEPTKPRVKGNASTMVHLDDPQERDVKAIAIKGSYAFVANGGSGTRVLYIPRISLLP